MLASLPPPRVQPMSPPSTTSQICGVKPALKHQRIVTQEMNSLFATDGIFYVQETHLPLRQSVLVEQKHSIVHGHQPDL